MQIEEWERMEMSFPILFNFLSMSGVHKHSHFLYNLSWGIMSLLQFGS